MSVAGTEILISLHGTTVGLFKKGKTSALCMVVCCMSLLYV